MRSDDFKGVPLPQPPLESGQRRNVYGVGTGVVVEVDAGGVAKVMVPSTVVPEVTVAHWSGPYLFDAGTWEPLTEDE